MLCRGNDGGPSEDMGCNHDIDLVVLDDLIKNIVVIWGVEGIVKEWVFYRELCCLFNDKPSGAGITAAYVKMGHMHLVAQGKFLEDIMVS
jgi:hypothetical protein